MAPSASTRQRSGVDVFGVIYAADGSAPDALLEVAHEFSPRVEAYGREVLLDLIGLSRLFGDAKTIAEELRRTAADRGLQIRVAIAGTRTAARLLVRHRAGLTVIESGTEAASLASLPEPFFTTATKVTRRRRLAQDTRRS